MERLERIALQIAEMWAFGLSGILLMFVGYWIFDKMTPRIDFSKELVENKNVAVAILIGSIILGVAVIAAAYMLPWPSGVAFAGSIQLTRNGEPNPVRPITRERVSRLAKKIMNQMTKTISLVLVSSALVFVGWGCPMAHDEQAENKQNNTSSGGYRHGHTMFWYYGPGYGYRGYGPGTGGGTSSAGHSSGASSRGGFGSSASGPSMS